MGACDSSRLTATRLAASPPGLACSDGLLVLLVGPLQIQHERLDDCIYRLLGAVNNQASAMYM